jgi:hypothetical protein
MQSNQGCSLQLCALADGVRHLRAGLQVCRMLARTYARVSLLGTWHVHDRRCTRAPTHLVIMLQVQQLVSTT